MYKLFGLVDRYYRGLEGITGIGRKGEAYSVVSPNTYGTSFRGFSIVIIVAHSGLGEVGKYSNNCILSR
jgi:hypothetical protein